MSSIIKRNYKLIIGVMIFLVLLPLFPLIIEIIFTAGNFVGTMIRQIGTHGVCI